MAWGEAAWSTSPWGADEIPNVVPPGWTPTPDGSSFSYLLRSGVGAWGFRSWAGAMAVPVYAGGGLTATPDPDSGVVRLRAWWPDAPIIQLIRITEDGTRTPVRGAYGLTVDGATRRNLCTNPSIETATTGYTPINGDTTLSQVQTTPYVTAGTSALSMVSTTTTTGAGLPGAFTGGGQWTIALDLGLTALATSVTVTVAWLTSTGASAGSTVLTLTASQIAAAVAQPYRAAWGFSAPSTAASGTVSLTIAGLTAGQPAYLDGVVLEKGLTGGSWYDGTTFGATWTGTAHLSTSVLAPVQDVVDGECPLDVPVVYEVYNPALVGGSAATDTVLLESRGRPWLTHPTRGDGPIVVDLRSTPARVHGIEQGVFWAKGRPRPLVISGAQRRAPTGTIAFNAITVDERDTLLGLFDDGSPVLLRCPSDYNRGLGTWYSLGELVEDPEGRKAWQDAWLLSAPYYEVDAPDPTLVA